MDFGATLKVDFASPLRIWTGFDDLRLDGVAWIGAGSVMELRLPEATEDGSGNLGLTLALNRASASVLEDAPGPVDVELAFARRTSTAWERYGPKWAGVLGAVRVTRFRDTLYVEAECVPLSLTPKYQAPTLRWSHADQLARTDNADTSMRHLAATVQSPIERFPKSVR